MRITKKDKRDQSSTSPCAHLRAAYHNCFNRWYSEKFVKGQWGKEECEHLDDKHLSRFLEAEIVPSDLGKPVDGVSQ
ncbi:hypothetical protein POTOM_023984 [Populus tomentosa]|uniref:Uncharacterized protein n=1 Tax=Populus tomentosa TaxID=118781 RepID=A0A8X8A110_POPTO|nr:hypothetical protein POTOM_023984 [Populus tomentosa]